MLSFMLAAFSFIVSVLGLYTTFKVDRLNLIFDSLDVSVIGNCVAFDPLNESMYIDKTAFIERVKYYFKENLSQFEYSLVFSFQDTTSHKVISETPNVVQVDLTSNGIFGSKYERNMRYTISGREVSKDWHTYY